jgi:lysophospholipid acyltransferase (LPLAT)-like uncharacterized protein
MFFKNKLERIKLFMIGFLGFAFARILFGTMIIEERPNNYAKKVKFQGKNVIYAFWHSSMLVPGYAGRNLGIKVLISHHTDGEYIARVVQRLGYGVIRGSTTRGGAKALLSMIKKVKEEKASLAITPDGPKGPRFVVQPGIIFLGQKTGYPIIPVSLVLTNYWELPSWDRFRIPKPFSKAIIMYGEPIIIPPKLEKSKVEEHRELLERTLNKMGIEADCMGKDM